MTSEMLPHPPATPLSGRPPCPLLLRLILLLCLVLVFDKRFPNRPMPDEDT